jgi:hypothetical protein
MLVKKYFQRPKDPRGIKLQEYDFRILALLDEYRFLDTRMVWELVKLFHPKLTWDTLKHRLHALWRNGYIDRPPEQLSILVKQDRFHLIMCLTKRGARAVSEHYGRDFQKTTWRVNQERANFLLLEHQLAISKFRAAVQLSGSFKIDFWFHDRQFEKPVVFRAHTEIQRRVFGARYVGQAVRRKVQPDSFLKLDGRSFALEIDRGTAGPKAMARKYLVYYKFLKLIEEEPLIVGKHEIKSFYVLTVSPDESHFERPGIRTKHLKEVVRAVTEGDSGPKGGWDLFLFTTEDQYNWQRPETITRPIWESPDGETFSLKALPNYHE